MNHRLQRVADSIKDLLVQTFCQELRDPRLSGVLVTSVRMSPDLSVAKVYYQIPNQIPTDSSTSSRDPRFTPAMSSPAPSPDEVRAGLLSCQGFLRSRIASQLALRRTPQLNFYLDESESRGAHIERLLAQIHEPEPPPACASIKEDTTT